VTRIFTVLAWLAILMVAANLILGLSLGDIRQLDATTLRWATVHRLLGVAAALAVVFANSIVVTYFIGTSRWAKEVVETYSLDVEFIRRTTVLKRRTFPWATLSMLVIVGVIALGGAADPATNRPGTDDWVTPHLIGSILGLAFIAWAAVIEWNNIFQNQQAIYDIQAEVRRIRIERGWETE
jgi:amino acid transporter